jgi:hypothetical protein
MKPKYKDAAFDRIEKLVEEVNKSIRQLGENSFKNILNDKFGLSNERASDFIEIFSEIVPGVSNDVIPKDWFFMNGRKNGASLRKVRHKIRNERREISDTIMSFWKLPKVSQAELIERWPDEWHRHIRREAIIAGEEEVVYTAGQIADLILAERYETTPTTINSYSKRDKWTDAMAVKTKSARRTLVSSR